MLFLIKQNKRTLLRRVQSNLQANYQWLLHKLSPLQDHKFLLLSSIISFGLLLILGVHTPLTSSPVTPVRDIDPSYNAP